MITFIDNSDKIKKLLEHATAAGLEAAAAEIEAQAMKNTPVDTGQLKGSWGHTVDDDNMVATIGNTQENAIWTEFGTGEFALEGKGRKGGWFYEDEEGEGHFTYGKKPIRMLHNAFITKKNTVARILEKSIKDSLN